MSTLLDKCNELRTLAAMLVVRDLPEVASLVREAADIIWQLHDDLQQAQADNAKLRKLLGKYHYALLAYKEEDDDSPCPLYICPDTTMCPWNNESCPFVEAINELGIEVDG